MSKGQGLPDEESNLHGDLCLVDFERKPAPVEQIFEQKEELSYPMAEDFATPTSAVHYQHIHDNGSVVNYQYFSLRILSLVIINCSFYRNSRSWSCLLQVF